MAKAQELMRIAVDFDNTLVTIDTDGNFSPAIGAREALELFIQRGYRIIIHTCRTGIAWRNGYLNEEIELIRATLERFSIPYHEIFAGDKLIANVYIDDRSVPYNGDWDAVALEIMNRKD